MTVDSNKNLTSWPDYRAIWRWHFYASLFCIPFVLLLAISGSIYLFKPQIDRFEERRFNDLLLTEKTRPMSEQVVAAISAVPGSVATSVELPERKQDATRVIVRKDKENIRVYIHPESLEVLGLRNENATFIRWVRTLHGQLHMGVRGSNLVELASSWTVIMIVTGLCLWWPRSIKGLGGVLYPRLTRSSHLFWRDLHSVTGIWISFLALFLLATGLPWAKFWGEYFRSARSVVASVASQDWTIGGEAPESSEGSVSNRMQGSGEHSTHHDKSAQSGGGERRGGIPFPNDLSELDRVASTATGLSLAHPVIITAPNKGTVEWNIKSDAQNRTLRGSVLVNGETGEVVQREYFKDRPWIDRIIGIGIAAHEGQLFGWPNQLLGLVTALGLVLLSFSGYIMWWRRRKKGTLGAPEALQSPRFRWPLVLTIVVLSVYLPMFGASLLLVLLFEYVVVRWSPAVGLWLGLQRG
jgi:uncharacterized iron-regulated membrane protein